MAEIPVTPAGTANANAHASDSLGPILLITLVATLGGFLFGYDSGVINGTVDGLREAFAGNQVGGFLYTTFVVIMLSIFAFFVPVTRERLGVVGAVVYAVAAIAITFGLAQWLSGSFNESGVGTGFSVSSMLLGSAVGALYAGRLADLFGRRNMLMVAAVLFIISAWGSGIADNASAFVVYRILGGLAVGAASVMAPAYISEIAPADRRGRLTSIQQVAIIAGLFLSFLANYILANTAGGSTAEFWGGFKTWRWMFWMELIPAFLFLGLLFFIPKSPRYLMVRNDEAGARRTLTRLFGEARADSMVADIRTSLANDHAPKVSDTISARGQRGLVFKPIVWIGIGLAAFQQLVGINVVFYYGAVLWQAVGFTENDALLINVLSGGLSIAAVMVTLLTIDRIGRKPFLVWGSVGMAITLAIVAWAFSNGALVDGTLELPGNFGLIALIAANAYVVCFNMSWGPVMWVMLGEMFPNQMRGSGLAIAGLSQWLTNFVITFTFPIFLAGIGLAAAYSIYAAFALISVFFVAVFVRETRGKTLEEMTE